ncbi:hypothetical protein RHMOL_Rhmol02G0012100 [Rhododendron molle]|uniref:Uncharacterized protein n=1 Tax=Rhododendron molle TaxID=49168 RepID=A0ACC0PKU7_RHOML|nr:hypothetical protein RHMOL_Rhmol02G0012100 [Rhododendron molle]
MLKFFCKSRHGISAAKASPTYVFYCHQTHPFSTSLKPMDKSSNQHSFTVTYLINSCGLSPEKALSASRYVKFETPDKPDSVLAFLRNHGFTQTQISSAISNYPPVIIRDTQKTLLPKLEYLKSKGFSSTDIARITSTSSFILQRSLENSIIPSFNFFGNVLQSEEKMLVFVRRCAGFRLFQNQSHVIPNTEILRKVGVPNANIGHLLISIPGPFTANSNRFSDCVDEVKKMGFDFSKKQFMLAILALLGMSKSTWEKKVEVYKKWGWTQDEILVAFKMHPRCMTVSEDKINGVMDFLVKKMGWESSLVARAPKIIQLSLEKRIVPRIAVYQALLSQGLIKASDIRFTTWIDLSEKMFLKKILSYKKEEATELLKLYKEKLDLAK